MQRLYLVPIVTVGNTRGPAYFSFGIPPGPGIVCQWSLMDYGFMPSGLLLAQNITEADDASLRSHADVYAFPAVALPSGLNVAIPSNNGIQAFCETINVPTDWTTASTTYLQLLRMLAGVFQFAQRYAGLSGGQPLLAAGVTLATRYRNLTAQQQQWFTATVTSFGYSASILNPNSTLRQMLKQAGDAWGAQPFYLGGVAF